MSQSTERGDRTEDCKHPELVLQMTAGVMWYLCHWCHKRFKYHLDPCDPEPIQMPTETERT